MKFNLSRLFVLSFVLILLAGFALSINLTAADKKTKEEAAVKLPSPFSKIPDLTADQKAKIGKIYNDSEKAKKLAAITKETAGMDKKSEECKAKKKEASVLRKELKEEAMNVLTPAQKEKATAKMPKAGSKDDKSKKESCD